jgi:branched-chain amino acid transport system permease protein
MTEGGPHTLAGTPDVAAPAGAVLDRNVEPAPGRRVPVGGLARTAALVVFVYFAWYQSFDFISLLSLAAIWAVATVGLGLVLGAAGQISLCQASFVLVGAYFYGAMAKQWSGPTLLALLFACVGGAAVALLTSPVLRARGYYLAIATMAVSLLTDRIVTTESWIPGRNTGIIGVPPLKIAGIHINTEGRYLTFSVILLVIIIALLHQRYGRGHMRRAIQALHHDEELLAGFGGNAVALKRQVFVVGGLLAGLAGGLYAGNFGYVSDNGFGLQESFALALAVFIGGNGRFLGAVLGAFVYEASFTILGNSLSDYRFAFLGGIVILSVHFFPRGLLPSREDFKGWIPEAGRKRPLPAADSEHHELDAVEPMAVSLGGLTKRYGALTAVDGVTLTVRPGSLTALIGPNGAGKTTLLDMIAADQWATSGHIQLDGKDVTAINRVKRARLGIARTYQRLRLVPSLNVLDNVLIGVDQASRRGGRVKEMERQSRAETALIDVGLMDRHDVNVETLTFGQRRLVEMARAITSRPRLVLLDEPSSGLNDAESAEFAEVIRRLHGTGCTIILVEHNLPFVRALAEDVIALDRGKLLAHGTTEEVFSSSEFQRSYVGAVEDGRSPSDHGRRDEVRGDQDAGLDAPRR